MDFKQTQQAYARLKDQLEQGRITAEEFEARVNEMVVTDSAGVRWQIGVSSGKWYRYDGQTWVEDMPPVSSHKVQGTAVYSQPAPASIKAHRSTLPLWIGGTIGFLALMICVTAGALLLYFNWGNLFPATPIPVSAPVNPPNTAVVPTIPSHTPEPQALPGSDPHAPLFFDDFSNSNSGWDDVVENDYSTQYMEGIYRMWQKDSNSFIWANPYLDFSGDIRVEVDAKKTFGSQYDEYGVLCRYARNSDDTHSYYYFAMAIDGLGIIYKVDHDEKSNISSPPLSMSGIVHPGEQVNRIRAECIGDKLTLYVNDQLLNSATDLSFASGDVGLRVDSETGMTEIIFDNFSVTSP